MPVNTNKKDKTTTSNDATKKRNDTKQQNEQENVEMKDEVEKKEETPEEKEARQRKEALQLLVSDLLGDIQLIQRAVKQNDDRLMGRALRQSFFVRHKLNRPVLTKVIQSVLANAPKEDNLSNTLLDALNAEASTSMDVSEEHANHNEMTAFEDESFNKSLKIPKIVLPEMEIYLYLMTVVYLIDRKCYSEAMKLSNQMIQHLNQFNRRTMSLLGAKTYFYFARAYEINKQPMSSIRPTLLNALRTASLRHDRAGQAVLINLLLRNYLADNLVDQASKLIDKTPVFDFRSNSQLARYFYYKGRIKSIQLDYSEAYDCLMNAIRKVPTTTARGFRLIAYKLSIIVQLLMGEIPDRAIFLQPDLKKALRPYFELTKQVRAGALNKFKDVVEQYADTFKADKTYTLIQRIRQNVIRTGLKKISLSYSRISFADICDKLHLDNTDDVEFIVAKAIRDGIIDATIDHEAQFIQSNDTIDVYSTSDPSEAFHKRITYYLKLHDDCIKAMRYPPNVKKQNEQELKEAEERRKSEQELVEEIVEEEDEEEEF